MCRDHCPAGTVAQDILDPRHKSGAKDLADDGAVRSRGKVPGAEKVFRFEESHLAWKSN